MQIIADWPNSLWIVSWGKNKDLRLFVGLKYVKEKIIVTNFAQISHLKITHMHILELMVLIRTRQDVYWLIFEQQVHLIWNILQMATINTGFV